METASHPLPGRLSESLSTPLKILSLLMLLQFTAFGSCAEVSVVWTVDGVSQFTLQDPLVVSLGDTLTFVYNDTFSNIWFQTDPQQYEECNCNAEGVLNVECSPRALISDCFDLETNISVPIVSNMSFYPSFMPGELYFFVSYSLGFSLFHACSTTNTGGECVSGLKLAVLVVAEVTSTTEARETTTSSSMVTNNTTSSAKILSQVLWWPAVMLLALQLVTCITSHLV